ncbi:hypothetical protein KSC_028060 [Ktedonobacter sp. SOSP1-52]|nr:hypothetical protein KSC_028060 [Ktedonobacter sp. SOSP1-52]
MWLTGLIWLTHKRLTLRTFSTDVAIGIKQISHDLLHKESPYSSCYKGWLSDINDKIKKLEIGVIT